jgi:hypothetical protein
VSFFNTPSPMVNLFITKALVRSSQISQCFLRPWRHLWTTHNYNHLHIFFRDLRVLNSPIISLTMGRRISTLKTRGFLSSIPLVRAIPEERLAEPITIYFEHKPGPNATMSTGANAICVLWVTFFADILEFLNNDTT